MKISIITAVHNGADSIATTLDSVAEQDHAAIEHIVVDGASSDATVETIRSHGARVAKLISEPDGGVYEAFNKGLRAASGDAVAYLNSGDAYVTRSVVSTLARALEHDGIQAVYGDLLIVDVRDPARVLRRYSSRHFTPRRMAFGLMPAHPTLLMRREIYASVGEYDPSFRIAGDFELCVRAFLRQKTRYRYIDQPLVRMPSGGISNSGWHSKWEITREMQRACALNGVSTNWAKLCMRFPLKVFELI